MSNCTPADLIHQLVDALQGALVDDILQYHSKEWIAKARKALADAKSYEKGPI